MSADPRLRARQQQQGTPAPPPVPPPPPPPTEPQPASMDGANDVPAPASTMPATVPDDKFKLKFCTVCASNQNRFVSTLPYCCS